MLSCVRNYPYHVSFNGIGPGGPYWEQQNIKETLEKIYPFGNLEIYYPITPILFNEFFNSLVYAWRAYGEHAEKKGVTCQVLVKVLDFKNLQWGRVVETCQMRLFPGIDICVGTGAKACEHKQQGGSQ